MAPPPPPAAPAPAAPRPALTLTVEMRKATRRAHSAANAIVLAKLAVALGDRATYARALASFHPVYVALETLLQTHRQHEVLGPVAEAALPLARAGAMEDDLCFLTGGAGPAAGATAGASVGGAGRGGKGRAAAAGSAAGWRWAAASSESAQAYAAHLQALADEDPALLIPYAFSLYVPVALGFLGKRVAKGLGVAPPTPAAGDGAGAAAAASAAASAAAAAAAAAASKKTDGDGDGDGAAAPRLASAGVRFFDLPATAGVEGSAALARLRAAADAAGGRLDPRRRERVVAQSLEMFRRNGAVVREFPLGARDVWRAATRARLVLVLAAAAVLLVLLAAAARAFGGRR